MTPNPHPQRFRFPTTALPGRTRVQPAKPAKNPYLHGLPGRTRSEKRANARAAQKAYLADKRAKS